jgi:hypothetical protein
MSFTCWAIAHGIHHEQGLIMRYKLIARQSTIDNLLKEWNKSIIWC